jgi:IS30 family transposase
MADGVSPRDAARQAGVSTTSAYRWRQSARRTFQAITPGQHTPSGSGLTFADVRGNDHDKMLCVIEYEPAGRRLSPRERDQIAIAKAEGKSLRQIGRQIGRDPATISRELARNTDPRGRYLPHQAQAMARERARRPKPSKLATNLALRHEVQERLKTKHSPEQISGRLLVDFPDNEEMRVSHETIYQALYVQSRGGLTRELTTYLRTGRKSRKPHRRPDQRRARTDDRINISERPAEADDRAIPGHWEGDLIIGKNSASAIGTLVERTTGFTMLLHLPKDHTALSVQQAIIPVIESLPDTLKRSLTWDQGVEMANHLKITEATNLQIYFADPHSPWQRGTNENTNGLLRQYYPKGTNLNQWGPDNLAETAKSLNTRPRKRLGFRTPAEALEALLSHRQQQSDSNVALTD